MARRDYGKIVYAIWATLVIAILASVVLGRWSMVFVALGTLLVSISPEVITRRMHIALPWPFFTGIVVFIFASLFLGEALDFYNRYWWWDVVLHTTSAIGFGMMGFVFVFALFEGDRYAAPPWALGLFGMCIAITLGVLWEIFEYFMDQTFGLNMQKSGLPDTMWDLIVDTIGSAVGGFSGSAFLKGREKGGLGGLVMEFIRLNRRYFKKFRRQK